MCLLEKGAEIDARDSWGATPLAWSVACDRNNTVELLLAHGATIDLADHLGRTPLLWAAYGGYGCLVELLLSRGADPNMRDNRGFNALDYAVSGGRLNVAKLLLSHGADVNSRSNDGGTALHTAAFRGHLDVVEWLTENGAEVDATNSQRQTPLFWAATGNGGLAPEMPPRIHFGQTEEAEAGKEEASRRNDKAGVVRCLLARGADVNASDELGRSPLGCAAHVGDVEITKLLLAGGAKVNTKYKDGWTALCFAAAHGYSGVVKVLLDRGADTGIKVKEIYTPLNYAVLNGHREAAELLIAADSQTSTIARTRCPGCGSNNQILIGAPLFVSDRQTRKILRCTVCGAIWAKRRIEWQGSIGGVLYTLVAAFLGFEAFHDRHGSALGRTLLVVVWILLGIQKFSECSERSRIWVQGTPESSAPN
jgi:cytohesin